MIRKLLSVAVAMTVLCGTAASAREVHVSGSSGRPIKITVEGAWSRNCTPREFPSYQTTEAPAHGSLSTRPETFTIHHSLSGDTTCFGRPGSGSALYYTSQPGFHGTDRLATSVTFPNGVPLDIVATINVR